MRLNNADLAQVLTRLTELADALGGKPPGKPGINTWADTLEGCRIDDVLAVLTDWPKTHTKCPAPAEVRKLAEDRRSRRIEDDARRQRENTPSLDQHAIVERAARYASTEAAKAAIERCRGLLAPSPSRRHPQQWAYNLRQRELDGEVLSVMQRAAWREAMGLTARAAADAKGSRFDESLAAVALNVAAPSDEQPAVYVQPGSEFGCASYGCPMPGALSESTRGAEPGASTRWWCRRHFQVEDSGQRNRITAEIRAEQSAPSRSAPARVAVAETADAVLDPADTFRSWD